MSQQYGNALGPGSYDPPRPSIVSPLTNLVGAYQSWPQVVRTKLRCKCGQEASYRQLATKTEPVRDTDALAIVEQREAVWCASCGVIAWVV